MAKTIANLSALLTMDSKGFDRGADKATKRTDRLAKEMERSGKRASALESQLVKTALKGVAAFGALELAAGGINAATKALEGNWSDAAEAVKQLPAIGGFARQLDQIVGTVTTLRRETELMTRVTQVGIANMAALYENLGEAIARTRRIQSYHENLPGAGVLTNAIAKQHQEAARIVRAHERAIEDLHMAARSASVAMQVENAREQQRLEAINKELWKYEKNVGLIVSTHLLRRFDTEIALLRHEADGLHRSIALRRGRVDSIRLEREALERLTPAYEAQARLMREAQVSLDPASDAVFQRFSDLQNRIEQFGKTQMQIDVAFMEQFAPQRVIGPYRRMVEQLKALEAQADAAAESQRRLDDIMRRGADRAERLRTEEEKIAEQIRQVNEELAAGAIGFRTYIRAMRELAAERGRLNAPREMIAPAIAPRPRIGTVDAITAGSAEEIRMQLAAGGQDAAARLQREQARDTKHVARGVSEMAAELVRIRAAAERDQEVDI